MTADLEQALAMSKDSKLKLEYNGRQIDSQVVIPRQDAPRPPVMRYTGTEHGPFIAVGLDLDAPYGNAPFLSPILHLLQSGLNTTGDGKLESEAPVMADWVQPAPPPLSAPHRYLILLYKQPATFGAGKIPLYKRVRWSLSDFVTENRLGDLLAANYFISN